MDNGMSLSDIAAVTGGKNDGFLEGNGIIILILFFLIFGFGGGWMNRGGNGEYATQADIQRGFDYSNVASKLDGITNGICNAGYENAQLANQTNMNMLNGFAGVNQTLNSGFDAVNQNINDLSYQMQQCCCSLKTQMLQDKYDDVRNQLNMAQIVGSNAAQTQNILNTLGRYYMTPSVNPYTAFNNCGCGI